MATQHHRVQLCFGGTAAEVGTEGDLDALKKQVESRLSLQPDSYGLFDTCGEVATPAALLRSLCATGEDICKLEVRERPVWKRLRELEARLQAAPAAEGGTVGPAALEALERRILGKVEGMIFDMEERLRSMEARLGHGESLVETVALEQISTRNKLDASVGPLLQSLALEQIDLKAALGQSAASLRSMVALGDSITQKIGDMAEAELRLREELAGLQQSTEALQGLEKKVSQLQAQQAAAASPKSPPKVNRAFQDALKETAQSATINFKDTEVAWPGTTGASPPGLFAYSTKASPLGAGAGAAFRVPAPAAAAAPFARGDPGARLRERRMLPSAASLSLPSLPPLQAS